MRHVAIATSRQVVDPDSALLVEALAAHAVRAELCVWDDPKVLWNSFDLVVVRSTWDYPGRRREFLDWAKGVAHLANPYGVLEYSSDKHYLRDLESHGVAIVSSHFCDVGKKPRFFDHDFVVKPCVGAGSLDAARYGAHDHEAARAHVTALHDAGRDVLIQPYVDSVDTLGERALIFIDGVFSHALTKGAMLNVPATERDFLFRREQITLVEPEADATASAAALLRVKNFDHLLYARVDLVATLAGWAVMELELVEPSLFLSFFAPGAELLASAIARRVA